MLVSNKEVELERKLKSLERKRDETGWWCCWGFALSLPIGDWAGVWCGLKETNESCFTRGLIYVPTPSHSQSGSFTWIISSFIMTASGSSFNLCLHLAPLPMYSSTSSRERRTHTFSTQCSLSLGLLLHMVLAIFDVYACMGSSRAPSLDSFNQANQGNLWDKKKRNVLDC